MSIVNSINIGEVANITWFNISPYSPIIFIIHSQQILSIIIVVNLISKSDALINSSYNNFRKFRRFNVIFKKDFYIS